MGFPLLPAAPTCARCARRRRRPRRVWTGRNCGGIDSLALVKIVVTRPIAEEALSILRSKGDVAVGSSEPPIPTADEVLRLIADADIVYTLPANPVNGDAIRGAKKLRMIATMGASYVDSLDELLARSDFVSLHVPLLAETRHLMDAARLRKMKRTAILINTSRGPVVDEKALAQALKEGVIAGAGLDVYEREPAVEPALLGLENAVLLPHIASASERTRPRMAVRAAENIRAVIQGQPLLDPVP